MPSEPDQSFMRTMQPLGKIFQEPDFNPEPLKFGKKYHILVGFYWHGEPLKCEKSTTFYRFS